MLTSFDMDIRPVFAMVLCGQPELNRILANRSQEALAQRITVRYHLVGMEREALVNRYALQALELAWRRGLERIDLKTMETATAF